MGMVANTETRRPPRRGASRAALVGSAWALSISGLGCGRGCETARQVPTIAVGQTVAGALETTDWTDVFVDRSYTDLYGLSLTGGEEVVIDMTSADFDTYLALLRRPGETVRDNDDVTAEDRNSRVVYVSPVAARYYVAATSLRAGETGRYSLSVRRTSSTPADAAARADQER
jgi:hypothetical protein